MPQEEDDGAAAKEPEDRSQKPRDPVSAAEPGFGLGPFSAPEPVAERLLPQASLALGFDYHFGRRSRPGVVLGLWLSAMLDLQGSRLVSDTVHECPLTLDPDARVCRTRTLAHTIGGGAEGLLSLRLGYDTAL